MGLIVQKFGGTSVANPEKILRAAQRAVDQKLAGHHVAVVVSARGDTTDELIELARQIDPDPPKRELDMLMATGEQVTIALLAMAIHRLGHRATSLTGGQMGIITDSAFGTARIERIATDRIHHLFDAGEIAIVAGFQGTDREWNITTLGRGGSDTTAVAIAAALGADVCEIYTDVDGIYTTDPRLVPTARKVDQISYDEMLELASMGAGVMHSRSIEFAKKYGVKIHVRHSGLDTLGTLIRPEIPEMEHVVVRGAALAQSEARITVRGVPDTPGSVLRIFSALAEARVVIDMIVQNVARDGRTEVSFAVAETDLELALRLAREAARVLGTEEVESSREVAKVSVVGLGMRTHTGVADRMFCALAEHGINIHMITTSEIKISVLVDRDRAVEALRLVHEEFKLHEPLPEYHEAIKLRPREEGFSGEEVPEERLRSIARNLPVMEDILVSHVVVDSRQARITLLGVPDRPGAAYRIFSRIAAAGVAVDMITQNISADQSTPLSFTVLKSTADLARQAALEIDGITADQVILDERMTKITVRGVGMRTHVGVAVRMFEALAAESINIQLINTSELTISVIVLEEEGDRAATALRRAFALTQ